jgi:site-specific DNA recombinase
MGARLNGARVAIYARYSSDKQSETSTEDQVRRCREHVAREGGIVPDELVFTDKAVSGAVAGRGAYERLMTLVRAKPCRVDFIVTESVSRLSRDLEGGAALFKRLRFAGVTLLGVGDGTDTSRKGAKVAYTVQNLMADEYLETLRDQTARGLDGRLQAGFSTGNPGYGYTSEPIKLPDGSTAYRTIIDAEKAKIVLWIFESYLAGWSLTRIAHDLNRRGIPASRKPEWGDSSVRVILHNGEKYSGRWTFRKTEWRRDPDSGKRVPRARADHDEVDVRERPGLAIIEQKLSAAVKARLNAIHAHYTKAEDGTPKGMAVPAKGSYLLSGLLYCGACAAPMVVYGGRYRCSHNRQRGTCDNRLMVREDLARDRLLAALRERLLSPSGIAHARKRLAERLGELSKGSTAEVAERRARLRRTEDRIRGLVAFIAEGDTSKYIRMTLTDLEAQADGEKAAIAEIERQARQPVRLPSPDVLIDRVFYLQRRLAADPRVGREELRRLFEGGRVRLEPDAEGTFYWARTGLLPMVLLAAGAEKEKRPLSGPPLQLTAGSGGEI